MRIIHVAVGVIVGADGKIFIAKRPDSAHQGGLWEFPGGKVDDGETIDQALQRELREELAIDVIRSEPLIKIKHDYGDKTVLLEVRKVTEFTGDPIGNEGQPVRWVNPRDLNQYEFPAANRPILTAINLPPRFLITGEAQSEADYLSRIEKSLKADIRLLQLRLKNPEAKESLSLTRRVMDLCQQYAAQLQLNASAAHYQALDADLDIISENVGLHLNSQHLMTLKSRPIPKSRLLSASCHNQTEIIHAQNIGVDFICLSPVAFTNSHPDSPVLGWDQFNSLVSAAAIPVYALGGMSESDLPRALQAGAQGIAAITEWWAQAPFNPQA